MEHFQESQRHIEQVKLHGSSSVARCTRLCGASRTRHVTLEEQRVLRFAVGFCELWDEGERIVFGEEFWRGKCAEVSDSLPIRCPGGGCSDLRCYGAPQCWSRLRFTSIPGSLLLRAPTPFSFTEEAKVSTPRRFARMPIPTTENPL